MLFFGMCLNGMANITQPHAGFVAGLDAALRGGGLPGNEVTDQLRRRLIVTAAEHECL